MDLKAQGKQWLTFLWEVRMHLLHSFGKGGVGGADQSMLRRNWHAGLSLPAGMSLAGQALDDNTMDAKER